MRVLLVTDVPPSDYFSGTLLTKQLCEFLPQGSIACFVALDPALNYIKKDHKPNWIPTEYIAKPRETALQILPRRIRFLYGYLNELYNCYVNTGRIVKSIVNFGKMKHVDRIWCILQGQTMIRLALPIKNALNVSLHTQVWDDPSWWLQSNGVDRFSSRRIMETYKKVIRNSDYFGAASFVMADMYKEEYGVAAVPLVASINSQWYTSNKNSYEDKIYIGIAGQLYSAFEWQILLRSLAKVNWRINNKRVIIRYLGYQINFDPSDPEVKAVNIEFCGYRSQEETIKIMSECDVLYCPYPFSQDFKKISLTSFPSKLTTYLAAGKPVLFHGPGYASPSLFLQNNNAGLLCPSLDCKDVIDSLNKLINDKNLSENLIKNGKIAFQNNLSLDNLRSNFFEFLKIKES
jgi:glycosyltransferase involved in cell wall biosynthesis